MPARIFCSYAHKDSGLCGDVMAHLSPMRREGLVTQFIDHKISPGGRIDQEIAAELASSQIVLLMISANFFDSEYCYSQELSSALSREMSGNVRLIPIILHDCDWRHSPVGALKALPKDGMAVSSWSNTHEALANVARGVREVVDELAAKETQSNFLDVFKSTIEFFRDKAEQLYMSREINSFNEQRILNVRASVNLLNRWIEEPNNAERLQIAVERYNSLARFLDEAKEFGFLDRFDVVHVSRLEETMKKIFDAYNHSSEVLVEVDWDEFVDARVLALRALYDEADRVQHQALPDAVKSLSATTLDRIEHLLEAIKADCSDSHFAPSRLSRKRFMIEEFRARLNACELLLLRHELALGHFAGLLPDLAVFRDAEDAPVVAAVPTGSYMMGSLEPEAGRYPDESPQHQVVIRHRFAVGRHSVTFAEYDAFIRETKRTSPADQGWGRGQRPVINVTWHDAQAYVAWLTALTGYTYRLPSEAEWEYLCRAGTITAYPWGDSISQRMANYQNSTNGKTTPVGSYRPNNWGIFDTVGNVLEWLEDDFHGSYEGAPIDGRPWLDSIPDEKILRGGRFVNSSRNVRCANRSRHKPTYRFYFVGFRVVRDVS